MEWVLRSPQIHSTFSNLGFIHEDGYHVNENCDAALETILHSILTEDKYLRTYRRNISFGQNINKDLIPLLIHAKEEKTIELLVRILVNLTIPVECLLSVDIISKNDFGRHTIFEINNLLATTKAAFTDHRATRIVIEFLKKNMELEQKTKLSVEQCTNISNSLLLLRNVLHIPEEINCQSPNYNAPTHTVQNQILWNIFSQSIDKILIKLMTIPDAANWGVTMVQLIALLYKDQHVVTLHKLLNMWLESSLSESSEDNESNTSPPDRGSEDSSPMLTSDPTSDSSDTGGSGKSNDEPNSDNNVWSSSSIQNYAENSDQHYQAPNEKKCEVSDKNESNENPKDESMKSDTVITPSCVIEVQSKPCERSSNGTSNSEKKTVISENSDCGYGTQIENQESISTSSNEDELPAKKPVHQKPHNPKQRINNKTRPSVNLHDRKRKKIVKRGKSNIINVQGLTHKTPTDEDISNVLKEFTVDFLLKGYNSLVQTLHNQILTNIHLEIDTSHFFWLVTYFLKFATQIELDLQHICSVLSFDIVSYLTAEGVNLCEQFELTIKLDGSDLKPNSRRLHLVVTAIREFVQAIEQYKKMTHLSKEDQDTLVQLQLKMCETEELRSLLVLLIRYYNPKYHTKQYLQDLVVTNHILLMFLDNVMKLPDYNGSTNMHDHINQFATPEIMFQYGLMLEEYAGNGEFVNDCIFTLMHHVGGELDSLITLFQPKILKTFASIWKSEYEICDDWSDLIEYVINTFIKKPDTLQTTVNFRLDTENFDDDPKLLKPLVTPAIQIKSFTPELHKRRKSNSNASYGAMEKWTEDELSALNWYYMQCNTLSDVIGEIIKMFKEDGITKRRESVIRELFKLKLINKDEFDQLTQSENETISKNVHVSKEMREDEIRKLCEQLTQDGKLKLLNWVQKVLLDSCYAKICLVKTMKSNRPDVTSDNTESNLLNFDIFNKKSIEIAVSPVSYHSILFDRSIPLVPWNCSQAAICKDLKFLQLLHKLGFHMPVDSGKVFIRIPHFWTAELLYEVAGKILPIDQTKLKFSLNDISEDSIISLKNEDRSILKANSRKNVTIMETPENFYQIHSRKRSATMVTFTPMPSTSFNTENAEIDKRNWLEIIQKSQEYKIPLHLMSGTREADGADTDIEMPVEEHVGKPYSTSLCSSFPAVAGMGPSALSSPPPHLSISTNTSLALPSIAPNIMPPVMSIKQQTTHYDMHLDDPEYCNNSVCETASVASDLTRMYVSDEDDKPEVLILPIVDNSNRNDDFSADMENGNAGKRPRIQFTSIF